MTLGSSALAVVFQPIQTLRGNVDFVTAIAMGPEDPDPASDRDGCLYALTGNTGVVRRICFDATKSVVSDAVVIDINGSLPVTNAMGMAFDPRSDAGGEIHLYITYSRDGAAPFNGRVARAVSVDGGVTFATDEAFITGLPRSEAPGTNQTNGLDFGPDGCLYIAQGANSNSGYDRGFAESRLSGAVLRACMTDASGVLLPGFDGNCGDGSLPQACDVSVFASGFRNPFGLAWHSNGFLYGTDNDVSLGYHLDCGIEANNFGCPCQEPTVQPIGDELNLVEEGMYYGAPNPYRAIPTGLQCHGGADAGDACATDLDCAGGTCMDLSGLCSDPLCGETAQCYYFGFGEDPLAGEDPNGVYRAPIAQVPALLDRITEYRASFAHRYPGTFSSDWDGQLLATGAPGPVQRFSLSGDGRSAVHEGDIGVAGAEGLDLAIGLDGTIYLADFSGASITYVVPVDPADRRDQLFSDSFTREVLGLNWRVDAQSFTIVAGQLVENSGARFRDGQLRWLGGVTNTPDQFEKLLVTSVATHTWGFMLRAGGPTGLHYEVHLPVGSAEWRWELYNPGFVERKGVCTGDAPIAAGDCIGATIEGAGPATIVSVWRWDADPDGGGPVDIGENWGPPDCTMVGALAPYVDEGSTIGVRSYTGSSSAPASADDWSGGDIGAAIGPPTVTCVVATDCDDGDACTDDACDPIIGCVSTPFDPLVVCDDGDACTADDCDPQVGCVSTPIDPTVDCNDANACTVDDCDSILGCTNTAIEPIVDCDDGDACTLDTCDPATGCGHTPLDPLVDCSDGNACTDDFCDPALGCTSTPILGCEADVRIVPVVRLTDPATTPSFASPVPPVSAPTVVGPSVYWVEIWASDTGLTNSGLTGIYVDVSYCGETVATEVNHGGVFTTFVNGVIRPTGVDEFGGSALPHGGGIEPEWVRVGWLTMNAGTIIQDCEIGLWPSTTGVGAFNRGSIPWDQVELGFATVSTGGGPAVANYDLDGDRFIGLGDLALWAASFDQPVPPALAEHDFDCDGFVGVGDLAWFATGWTKPAGDPMIMYPPSCAGPLFARAPDSTDVEFRLAARSHPSRVDVSPVPPPSNLLRPVSPGEAFYLEVWATDVGDVNTGLTSAYLDLVWPGDIIHARSIGHRGAFTHFAGGLIEPNAVRGLGGSALPNGGGVQSQWVRVAVVEMYTEASVSSVTFALEPDQTGVAAYGRGLVPWNDVVLEGLTISELSKSRGRLRPR